MADVFISYSHENRDAARIIAETITAKGYDVWWDRDLIAGDDYTEIIEEVLDKAKAVIVVWSAVSRKSYWVRDEAAVGRDRNRLLPVMIDDNLPPLGFRQIHTVNLAGWDGKSEDRLEDIFHGLEGLVGGGVGEILPEPEPETTNPFGAPLPPEAPPSETVPSENTPTKAKRASEAAQTPDMGRKIFAGVNAKPVHKPMKQIMKEEKRQRSFLATFWLTSLIVSGALSLALGLYANSTESFAGQHWVVNVITAFLFVGVGLIFGRFLIAIGRRLAKRKSVLYFDLPTNICFIISAVMGVFLYMAFRTEIDGAEAETIADSIFMAPLVSFTVVFPICAFVSVIIGAIKGATRKSFDQKTKETAELFA